MTKEKKPSALKFRQGLQTLFTASRKLMFDVQFNKDDFELIKMDIELENLDPIFDGYKIVNLSDIHLGQWLNPTYLNGVIEYVNELNADLITLTGDYVSYILKGYEKPLEKAFEKLDAKDGKVGVLGNHDHWLGAEKIRNIFKKAGVIDLSNDVHTIKRKDDNEGEYYLNIAGIDSYMIGKDNIGEVLDKLPDKGASILLVHEPDFAEISSRTGKFDMQISGHSHGGQCIIPGLDTTIFRGPYSTKYPVGLYDINNMIQYTSKGLGTNVFWMRINCKPEITLFTLKSKE